jgi:transcription factor-like protein
LGLKLTVKGAFKRKLQQESRPDPGIDIDAFFVPKEKPVDVMANVPLCWTSPARMLSDKLVNIFFQEFAPLFPILHRPSFLSLYGEYISNSEPVKDHKSTAQLFLVFGIAGLSSQSGASEQDIRSFESQWKLALDTFATEDSLIALQCLVAATLYYLMKAEYSEMLKYKGHAIALAQRLGLHQSQKRFTLGALTIETRKKLFWTIYTLDW